MNNSLGHSPARAQIARMLWALAGRALPAGYRKEAAIRCILVQRWV